MELKRFLILALRALLLFSSIVVLALSVATNNYLARYTEAGSDPPVSPVQYRFAIFAGAFGITDAAVGIVAEFVTAIPWLAVLIVDCLAGIFFLSGGVKLASIGYMRECGSCSKDDWHEDGAVSFCKETKSDYAFMFFCLVILAAVVGLGFIRRRREKTASASGGV
ncbi:hypothetical protein KC333_g7664 [Hortaea werneckii]|nr:hypothetical protein KC333_g7664 [Hortaea werneckii]KAI7307606.1 hypothetical protein KC326_g7628 [Hortaea werneckii]